MFLIEKGSCVVYRTVEINEDEKIFKKRIPICRLGEGSIVGEECLFAPHDYEYTVRVESSILKVLCCNRSGGMKEFKRNNILGYLELIYQRKK
jgi:hypothetical protein